MVWPHHFLLLPGDGHLDCFSLLLVMLNAVNVHVQVFCVGRCFQVIEFIWDGFVGSHDNALAF